MLPWPVDAWAMCWGNMDRWASFRQSRPVSLGREVLSSGLASDALFSRLADDVRGEVSGQFEGVSYESIEVWSLAG